MPDESIVMNREDLIAANDVTHEEGLNRKLNGDFLRQWLDPNGVNVVSPMFEHDRKSGQPCEPHMRCSIQMKLKGQEEAHGGILDIKMDLFNKLTRWVKVDGEWVDKRDLVTIGGNKGVGKRA